MDDKTVTINRSYKFRIYPNKQQQELIQKTFGCVRFVYNYFLKDCIDAYQNNHENRSYAQQCASLVELKKELLWLKEPDKSSLQYALQNLHDAYRKFFASISGKQKSKIGYPKFKSKKRDNKRYTTSANGKYKAISVGEGFLKLPKLGYVKAKISRNIPVGHRIISATISQSKSGKYFTTIHMEWETEIIEKEIRSSVGLDYSSPHFYVDSEGNEANMPHFYREWERRLAREQRRLSKMVNGSNNYRKQKIRVAKMYEKVRNCREDWQHKESTRLADKYDLIAVEDIDYQDMARGLRLAKATNDNAFGQFRRFLAYKLAERGKKLITIDKWFPSSKLCRFCGTVNSDLTLKDREWDCPGCGAHLLRDVNAAINICNKGSEAI